MTDKDNADDVVFDDAESSPRDFDVEEVEARVEDKLKANKSELDEARAQAKEYLDGWQRSQADYVNAQKRFETEKLSALTLGRVAAVRAFLPAIDSLARAKAHGALSPEFEAIEKQLLAALLAVGVEAFGAVGDAFKPELHEALGTDEGEAKDTVSAVLEAGYKAGDFVVRPAKVRVVA